MNRRGFITALTAVAAVPLVLGKHLRRALTREPLEDLTYGGLFSAPGQLLFEQRFYPSITVKNGDKVFFSVTLKEGPQGLFDLTCERMYREEA